jgi:hypothetical protein
MSAKTAIVRRRVLILVIYRLHPLGARWEAGKDLRAYSPFSIRYTRASGSPMTLK